MWAQMRGPVLGMLRAVFGADRDAQHHGHLQHAGRHGLPLGHLVEDLVAGAAHEVTVHQLGHDAAAAHGVAHARAHDGTLGDRRVEEAMVGQTSRSARGRRRTRRPSPGSPRRRRPWSGPRRSDRPWPRRAPRRRSGSAGGAAACRSRPGRSGFLASVTLRRLSSAGISTSGSRSSMRSWGVLENIRSPISSEPMLM